MYNEPNFGDDLWKYLDEKEGAWKNWNAKAKSGMTEAQAETLWTYWDEDYRKHALKAVESSSPKVPFSCESRLKIEKHKSTFSKILEAGLNP